MGHFEPLSIILAIAAFALAFVQFLFAITDGGSLPFIMCASFTKLLYLFGTFVMCVHIMIEKGKMKKNFGYPVLAFIVSCNSMIFFGYACLAQLGDQERRKRAR